MSDEKPSEIVDDQQSEIIETRTRNLEHFAQWMIESGLSPLDFELVEEKRADGVTLWYFRKRDVNQEIPFSDPIENQFFN